MERKGWYHGWNVVAVVVVSAIVARGIPVSAFSLYLPDWSREFGVPISTLHLMLAPLAVTCAVIAPVIGGLADRLQARWLFGLGLGLSAVLFVAVGFVSAFWQLALLYAVLLPFTLNLSATIAGNPLIARWFVKRLGLALGLSGFGIGFAGVLWPPIIAAVVPLIGWRHFWQLAGLATAVLVAPLVVSILRDRPTQEEGRDYLDGEAGSARSHARAGGAGHISLWSIVKRRNFLVLLTVLFVILAGHGGVLQNLAPLAEARGLSAQVAGWLVSLLSLTQVISTLGLGLAADRYGDRKPLLALCLFGAAGTAVVAVAGNMVTLAIGVALVGVSGGIWTSVGAALAREFGPDFGKAYGAAILCAPLSALAPFVVARVHELTGNYTAGLLPITALAIAGAVTATLAFREVAPGPAATAA